MFFLIFSSIYLFVFYFNKKLIPLLSMELMMLFIIMMIFLNNMSLFKDINFSIGLLFLTFMVLDSVLGLCLLLLFCRVSNKVTLKIN